MSRTISVEIDDTTFDALSRLVAGTDERPEQRAAGLLRLLVRPERPERNGPPVPGAFERHFGSFVLDTPSDGSNESIDADLAREYAGSSGD